MDDKDKTLNLADESKQLSLIYKFLFDHFEAYLDSDSDAADKMSKILRIIKGK